jgi:Spy/CpxP family protein refolding chaperone
MSTVRTLALGALMVVGVAGVSAAQSTASPSTRSHAGSDHRGHGGSARREGFARELNLTDAQKAQVKAIRDKYKPQNEALRAQAKPFVDAAHAARQKGDTAAFRTNIEKAHQIRDGASFRAQERAEIRAVLTPEQQAKFDAREKSRAEGRHKGWEPKSKDAKPAAKK